MCGAGAPAPEPEAAAAPAAAPRAAGPQPSPRLSSPLAARRDSPESGEAPPSARGASPLARGGRRPAPLVLPDAALSAALPPGRRAWALFDRALAPGGTTPARGAHGAAASSSPEPEPEPEPEAGRESSASPAEHRAAAPAAEKKGFMAALTSFVMSPSPVREPPRCGPAAAR